MDELKEKIEKLQADLATLQQQRAAIKRQMDENSVLVLKTEGAIQVLQQMVKPEEVKPKKEKATA